MREDYGLFLYKFHLLCFRSIWAHLVGCIRDVFQYMIFRPKSVYQPTHSWPSLLLQIYTELVPIYHSPPAKLHYSKVPGSLRFREWTSFLKSHKAFLPKAGSDGPSFQGWSRLFTEDTGLCSALT